MLCVCLAQLVIGVYNTLDIGIVFDALYRGQASDRINDGLLQTKDLLPLLGVGTGVFRTAVENIECTIEIAGVGVILRQQHGNCVGFHAGERCGVLGSKRLVVVVAHQIGHFVVVCLKQVDFCAQLEVIKGQIVAVQLALRD